MALHAQHAGRDGGRSRGLPRLELVAEEPWPQASGPPAGYTWSEYGRSVFWLVRCYLDARESPASVDRRIDRACWAARVGFLDIAYERSDQEMAIATARSVRSIEAARADLRAALIRVGRRLPDADPPSIPVEFA